MKNIRLMLVDDEDRFRETMSKRLNKRGMDVLDAGDGEICLDLLKQHPVDVVVSDVKMPGMGGIELLQRIKESYPDIEVILLTGHASASDGVEGIKAGAFDYLSKPMEFEHLLSKIKQAYEKIKRLQEQKTEADFRERMEQQMIITERLASLGTLATGVAHEINNPLAIIKEAAGWMMLILKKEEMAAIPRRADFEKALDKIEKGVERAKRITHQLLGFVQKNESVMSVIKLRDLINESLQLTGREAANKEIEIVKVFKDDADGSLISDPYQLRQVLLNLITNAIHASSKGDKITLTLENQEKTVLLTISDTGCGIPQESLEKIFEPFFTTKPPGKGTGLGLFVSSGIIERLGGTLDLESTLGKGTTFTIELPRNYHMPAEAVHGSSHDDAKNRFSSMKKICRVIINKGENDNG